ncbi:hypothetical protein B0H19DRAFT_967952 [Mycena capillaripes]|nr:hypothetical protein B0H19DRAFT_967952 [Mycena capillaripes]
MWSLCLQLPVSASEINLDSRHHGSSVEIPGNPTPHYKSLVIAHALLGVFGFALCLPAGVLLARYLRTSRPWWYMGHWIAQVGVAGPIILVNISLGFVASSAYGGSHKATHKTTGTVMLVLYIDQCITGAVIHFFKPKNAKRRPIQNYLHAFLGLAIIALGMYQIYTGYAQEWPDTSLGKLPKGLNALFILWCILLAIVYGVGMRFISKQYAQEAAARLHSTTTSAELGDHIGMARLDAQLERGSTAVPKGYDDK